MLQFFSASTNIVNSKRAITECLENALKSEPNLNCDLIIIHSAMGHNFKDLLNEARRLSPGAQIIGCSCSGIIGKDGPDESMKALAIMVVKGQNTDFVTAAFDSSWRSDPYNSGIRLAMNLKEKNPGINMILLFSPAGASNLYEYIAGIELVFGRDILIFGGVSYDGKMISSYQFFNDNVIENCLVMAGFANNTLELISKANHGLEVIEEPFVVTRSDKNHILELNGQNPWKVLMEKLQRPITTSPLDVYAYVSLATEISDELSEEYGSKYHIVAGLFPLSDGTLLSIYPYQEGTKFWLTRRNEQKIFEGVDQITEYILRLCEGRRPVAVFHSDCATRGRLLFDKILKDELIKKLQYPICKGENIPWLGLYGAGEICPLGGRNMLHLYTSSLNVLVHKK